MRIYPDICGYLMRINARVVEYIRINLRQIYPDIFAIKNFLMYIIKIEQIMNS
jgi:hypothetical protein